MWNYSLSFAAKKLGYRNPSKLSKIENSRDAHSVPLHIIMRAAVFYGVSIDFLFGLSDDFERAPEVARERSIATWLGEEWQRQRARDLGAFAVVGGKLVSLEQCLDQFQQQSRKVSTALNVFINANPDYEDMPKLNPLLCGIHRLTEITHDSEALLRRLGKGNPSKPCESKDINAVVERLAGLDELAYEQARRGEAALFGIRACYLDRLVKRKKLEIEWAQKSKQQMQLDL